MKQADEIARVRWLLVHMDEEMNLLDTEIDSIPDEAVWRVINNRVGSARRWLDQALGK